MTFRWRQMTEGDLDAVERIAGLVHPAFFERHEVLADKQRLYPMGSWLCEREGDAVGYLLTHPWHADAIPELDRPLTTIPARGTYYLHDLALLSDVRRTGASRAGVELALAHATKAGFQTASLVAVNDSQAFWMKHGFAAIDVPGLADELRAYELGARYMTRSLVTARAS
jgi:GNAT superfamily N-acetyltransferase